MSKAKQLLYIGEMYDKRKFGVTGNNKTRMDSYGKGNHNPVIHWLGFADDAHIEHIIDCERYLIRTLSEVLERGKGGALTEYIKPEHTHITVDYLIKLTEKKIKSHPLKIRRLKAEFLPITKADKNLLANIKAFPDKYLEDIA